MKEIAGQIFTKGALKTVLTFIAGGSFMIVGYVKFVRPFLEQIKDIKESQQVVINKIGQPSRTDSLTIQWLFEVRTDIIKIRNQYKTHNDILKDLIKTNKELQQDQKYYFYRLENSSVDSLLKKKNLSSLMYTGGLVNK